MLGGGVGVTKAGHDGSRGMQVVQARGKHDRTAVWRPRQWKDVATVHTAQGPGSGELGLLDRHQQRAAPDLLRHHADDPGADPTAPKLQAGLALKGLGFGDFHLRPQRARDGHARVIEVGLRDGDLGQRLRLR